MDEETWLECGGEKRTKMKKKGSMRRNRLKRGSGWDEVRRHGREVKGMGIRREGNVG